MMFTTANPVFTAYVVSAAVLGLNLLVLANNTALARVKAKEVVNPEDRTFGPNQDSKVVYEAGSELPERYRRAHRNALENIPLFLITAFVLTLTGVSATLATALFGIFVVARVFHSIAYIKQLQPWRTLSFGIGAVDQVVILGVLLWQVLAA